MSGGRAVFETINGPAPGADASEVAFDGMPHNVFFEDAKPEECSRAICGFVAECF